MVKLGRSVPERALKAPLYDAATAVAGLAPDEAAFAQAIASDGAVRIDLDPHAVALCDRAVAETEPLFRGDVHTRVHDAWRRSRAVRKLATDPKILRLLEAAHGRRPFAFQTLSFRRGTQQALHADTIHFNTDPPGFMCGVWIALEDIRPEAGPLVYSPGSHRLPVLSMRDVGVNGAPTLADYQRHYEPRFAERLAAAGLSAEQVVLKKGQAFAWAANLAHGGAPISDPGSTRRSLVVHYFFEGAVYYTPRLSDEPGGALRLRLPTDVATGGWVWPRRAGRRIALPFREVLAAAGRRLLNRPTRV